MSDTFFTPDDPQDPTPVISQVNLPVQKTILGKLKKLFNKSKAEVISDAIPEEQSGSNVFTVVFSGLTAEGNASCDKSFNDIKQAIENNVPINAYWHNGASGTDYIRVGLNYSHQDGDLVHVIRFENIYSFVSAEHHEGDVFEYSFIICSLTDDDGLIGLFIESGRVSAQNQIT